MPSNWGHRMTRLCYILGVDINHNEEDLGLALDEYSASRTREDREDLERLCFTDHDLSFIGKLAVGQFGAVDLVRCRLDSKLYVRKTIEKRTALRTRGQCSPQIERDILTSALKLNSLWAPHLLCAFQTATSLKLVMQYADGGNLWDVIESSPEGKISESDLQWWIPQIVSAVEWCHSQGFVHRDIKPHNFVLTASSHLLLIDFGSAAPLLPPSPSGVQLVPKEYCLVPCGTCDYISPEILQCHEEALVAMELAEDHVSSRNDPNTGEDVGMYGRETDWWSFGAMLYEMAFGVAPFFAHDVGHTYINIIEYRTSLNLSALTTLSNSALSLLAGVLCDRERRLGRLSTSQIKEHHFFDYVDWTNLHQQNTPAHVHLPQYTYSAVIADKPEDHTISRLDATDDEEHRSEVFPFSTLFQSSSGSLAGIPMLQVTPPSTHDLRPVVDRAWNAFIGFSWGPRLDAFNASSDFNCNGTLPICSLLHPEPVNPTAPPIFPLSNTDQSPHLQAFRTPVRANSVTLHGDTASLERTGIIRRMQGGRPMSDREAMQRLVDCIGMSARRKVLESGKKSMHVRTASGLLNHRNNLKRFVPPKPSTTNVNKGDMSATTSESESQPPSPTPRPASALSRKSGWGGRSTPSIMAGRSTPTLTLTATGTEGSGRFNKSNANHTALGVSSTGVTPFDGKLHDAEQRHRKLLAELALLEKNIGTLALDLKRQG